MIAQNWNHGWLFDAPETGRKTAVTLPHDGMWNTPRDASIRNYFLSAGFLGETYVYTKHFTAPEAWYGKRVIAEFESVYCMTTVTVNGEDVAFHPYGFTPFTVDMSERLHYGGENVIQVRAEVPREGHCRWYTGGGIYRPVNLYVAEPEHIDLYGLKVTTLGIRPASIRVETKYTGGDEVQVTVLEGDHPIAQGTGDSIIFTIPDAKLWSAEHPHLYCVKAVLLKDGQIADTAEETFGIRTIAVNPEQGLLINGEREFLRGGCIHIDNGVIGVVNNDATELRRAQNIKRAGFNAIRSAHHPMSRSLMRACDQVGLYVMDEAFDMWYRPKNQNPYLQHFMDCYQQDAALMAQDAYNHPCVLMYSIGNEIPEAGGVKGVCVGKNIAAAIRAVDDTRLLLLSPSVHWLREYLAGTPYLTRNEDEFMAESEENRRFDWQHYMGIFMGAAANIPDSEKGEAYPQTYVRMDEDATRNLYAVLDVAGYNYYEDKYETLHQLHPERVILGTETRGDRIVDTMRFAAAHPYLIGDFIWTLQDHLGECNTCNERYEDEEINPEDPRPVGLQGKDYPWLLNHAGMLDLSGRPIPALHRHELAWGRKGLWLAAQVPVHNGVAPSYTAYLWTDSIESWSFDGCEGQKTFVDVYTDAAEAEVLVNQVSLGRQPVKDYFAKFPCIYQPGTVTAIGYDTDGKEIYRASLSTGGTETCITAIPEKPGLLAGGEDYCFVNIAITDTRGIIKAYPDREVHISVSGEGELAGFGSCAPRNESRFDTETQLTYQGRLQAAIRSGTHPGKITVVLWEEGTDCRTALEIPVYGQ